MNKTFSPPVFEHLEPRRLMSVSVDAQTGMLEVFSGGRHDAVDIVAANETMTVTLNGRAREFDLGAITGFDVRTGGGDDRVTIDGSVTLPGTIDSGPGDDLLTGGGGDDLILARRGDDTVIGSLGVDTVRPGRGMLELRLEHLPALSGGVVEVEGTATGRLHGRSQGL